MREKIATLLSKKERLTAKMTVSPELGHFTKNAYASGEKVP